MFIMEKAVKAHKNWGGGFVHFAIQQLVPT